MKILKITGLCLIAFCLFSGNALADMGPSCSCDTPGEGGDCFGYNAELDMGYAACKAYADRSGFCRYATREENALVFNGFWSVYDGGSGEGEHVSPVEHCTQFCKNECPMVKPEEGSADYEHKLNLYNKCVEYFKPQEFNCQDIPNETDRAQCEQICHNNALTSKCGIDCLQGKEYIIEDITAINVESLQINDETLQEISRFCSKETTSDYYTSSISVNRPKAWSLLAILVAALAAVTTLLITFYNRSDKKNATNNDKS